MARKRLAVLIAGILVGSTVLAVAFAAQYSPLPQPIYTGGFDPTAVAINNTTGKIYAANTGTNDVAVIDASNNQLIKNIPVDVGPYGLAVDESRNLIYVSHWGKYSASGATVKVIDGSTDSIAATISTGGVGGYGIAINPTANKIYVANNGSNDVTVIDGATRTGTLVTLPTGVADICDVLPPPPSCPSYHQVTTFAHPVGLGIDLTANKVYVAAPGTASVAVIDGATNGVTSINDIYTPSCEPCIQRISGPFAIAVNSASNRVYVSMTGLNRIGIIDTTSASVIDFIGHTGGTALAIDSAANRLLAAAYSTSGGQIKAYNLTTKAKVSFGPGGDPYVGFGGPLSIAVKGDGAIYAASPGSQNPWFRRAYEDPFYGCLFNASACASGANAGWQSTNPGQLVKLLSAG